MYCVFLANFRGLDHFRSFKTNYGSWTAGKDTMLVFTPDSEKNHFMGCVIPVKTERQIEPRYDLAMMDFFASNPRSFVP